MPNRLRKVLVATRPTSGTALKSINSNATVKVIAYLNKKSYSVLIDGKEYAKSIPFFNNSVNKINEMRAFLNRISTKKLSGITIDKVTLFVKNNSKYTATESSFGDFYVKRRD